MTIALAFILTSTVLAATELGSAEEPAPIEEPSAAAPESARVAIHFFQARLGYQGISWDAGPSVDFRISEHGSLSGGLLFVGDGYLGIVLEAAVRWHPRRFDEGLYLQAGAGTASVLGFSGASVAARMGPRAAWRWRLDRDPDRPFFGVLDTGIAAHLELSSDGMDFLGGPSLGAAIDLTGGLGL